MLGNYRRLTRLFPCFLFMLGVVLVALAWIKSYPVLIPQVGEYVFDKIYPSLWLGLSLIFISLFLISINNSGSMKTLYVCVVLFVFFLYIHYLFFPLIPGSDAHYFRGLTRLFSNVGVDPNAQGYFQWPSFFIINKVLVEVLGLGIDALSFLMFMLIGFLIASSLFLLFSSENRKLGFIGVALYFLGLFWFLNYQFAPQSLALGLFFLLVNVTSKRGLAQAIVSILLFISLVFTHSFIPVLFLIFYFVLTLRDRGRISSFLLYSAIYVSFLIYFAVFHFNSLVLTLTNLYYAFGEYGTYAHVILRTLRGPVSPFDAVAQFFSRGITISIWLILLAGFIYRILRKDVNFRTFALLLSGFFYAVIGTHFNILGERAIQIIFASLAFGYKPFLTKYRKLITCCVAVMLALFPFVIIHSIYDNPLVQTPSGKLLSERLIDNGFSTVSLLASPYDGYYIYGSLPVANAIRLRTWQYFTSLEQLLADNYDYIIYNHKLEKELLYAYSIGYSQIHEVRTYFLKIYNKVWDEGDGWILSK